MSYLNSGYLDEIFLDILRIIIIGFNTNCSS